MLKNVNSLSELLNLEHQKKDFDNQIDSILKLIKVETNLDLKNGNIFIKNNNLKIKASSSIKFIILLHLTQINKKIKLINKDFILEL